MLKANLEKINSVNDAYLNQLISVAKAEITREGVVLNTTEATDPDAGGISTTYSMDDANLIVMYAAYLYRNRAGNGEGYSTTALHPQGMPYMLRLALNNHLFSRKMETES